MPEAAVDEDGGAEPGEDEVGVDAGDASQVIGHGSWVIGSGNPGLGTCHFALGPSRGERQRAAPSPARDAMRPENLNQPQLGGFVAGATNQGHYFGALPFGEDVGHLEKLKTKSTYLLLGSTAQEYVLVVKFEEEFLVSVESAYVYIARSNTHSV